MQLARIVHTLLLCLLLVGGGSVCAAEAAEILPKSDCCPSSQDQAPETPAYPLDVCCQLAQARFIASEEKLGVEYTEISSEKKCVGTLTNASVFPFQRRFAPSPRHHWSGPPVIPDSLRYVRNPRAPAA